VEARSVFVVEETLPVGVPAEVADEPFVGDKCQTLRAFPVHQQQHLSSGSLSLPHHPHPHCMLFIHVPKTGGTSIRKTRPDWLMGRQHEPLRAYAVDASEVLAVVRDPWERLHSWWRYNWVHRGFASFERYVLEKSLGEEYRAGLPIMDQYEWIRDGSRQVGHLLRFERLREDFSPWGELPCLNRNPREEQYPYSPDLWTVGMLRRVRDVLQPFGDEFGYEEP
jgi:hypothetical protein